MRIKSSQLFARVFRDGVVAADGVLVVHASLQSDNTAGAKLGLAVGRRVGNAPVRNRWKRLIREAFRLERHRLPLGLYLVVRPKKGAVADAWAVRNSLVRMARKAKKRIEEADVSRS
ncbi:MAG TPA: ribonuclease P protein component [Planctomycetaceae bacterium]|nr:ribonuclease P protein component [Planctomycetaceae bacterium]